MGALLHIDHVFEIDHFDADLFLMLAHQILGIIGAIEVFACRVLTRSGVVATDDEMGAAVVLADKRVPNGLARPGHAHRKVQKRHGRGRPRIFVEHRLIAAHAGKVIDIARFGHADNRMDEKVGLRFFCGAEGQFLMCAVQRVACLEGNDLAPAKFAEMGAQFVGGIAPGAEIVMHRLLDAGHRTAEIDLARVVVQVVNCWVRLVISAKDVFGFLGFVRNPVVSDRQRGEDDAFLIAQCDILPFLERGGEFFRHIKRDRHRPERSVRKAHVLDDAVIIFFRQEPFERIEPAIHQKLEVADLARGQIPAYEVGCLDFELLSALV